MRRTSPSLKTGGRKKPFIQPRLPLPPASATTGSLRLLTSRPSRGRATLPQKQREAPPGPEEQTAAQPRGEESPPSSHRRRRGRGIVMLPS